jgi:hypothetical protein
LIATPLATPSAVQADSRYKSFGSTRASRVQAVTLPAEKSARCLPRAAPRGMPLDKLESSTGAVTLGAPFYTKDWCMILPDPANQGRARACSFSWWTTSLTSKRCFASNSGATYALAGSRWSLPNPLQARSSASLMLLEYHSYRSSLTSTCRK